MLMKDWIATCVDLVLAISDQKARGLDDTSQETELSEHMKRIPNERISPADAREFALALKEALNSTNEQK